MYYLAQKYTGIEEEAIEFAHEMVNEFHKRGLMLFSPILYSHYHAEWLRKKREGCWYSGKGYNSKDCLTHECKYFDKCPYFQYPEPDWVEFDLKMCEKWLNNNSYTECPLCNTKYMLYKGCKCQCEKEAGFDYEEQTIIDTKWNFGAYDSGLVMLFAKNCYEMQTINHVDWTKLNQAEQQFLVEPSKDKIEKTTARTLFSDEISKGARKEYEWAKKNYVRCLKLEEFLQGKEVEL